METTDFKTWFQASPNAYLMLTPQFEIAWANAAYLLLTGRQLEQLLACSIFAAFSVDDDPAQVEGQTQLRRSLERALNEKTRDSLPRLRYPIAVPGVDGELVSRDRYWSVTHTPVLGPQGEVRFILQHTEDITEHFHAQPTDAQPNLNGRILRRVSAVQEVNRNLLADLSHLRQLFDQAPGFVCFLRGPEHVIEMSNDAYLQLIGKHDVLGRSMREVLPVDENGMHALLDQVYASGEAYVGKGVRVEFAREAAEAAREHFLDFVYQPIRGEGGEVAGIFVQGHDVTEQKIARDELQVYREQLEQLVIERTRELRDSEEERRRALEALHQAQKMEAVGNLTGGVAHDFNNVLQIIGGNLQLLAATAEMDASAHRRLQAAISGVGRGAKLASQLLAFARRQPLEPRVINVSRLLRNMDEMLRRALGEACELETVVGGGLWNTAVDPNQLENVLLNLAINARDAMASQGRLTIEVGNAQLDDDYAHLHREVAAGQYVMLAVTDTGSGMAPAILERAFDPFFTTKPEGHGTGLGLSMVYGFVKQTGGHIKIYSEPDMGTCIKIYLPRAHAAEEAIAQVPSGPIGGGSETVLVVEDDAEVRATVVDMLGDLGYHVLQAADAQSALSIVTSGAAIDLLFTDVVMPGPLRSPELARQAKAAQPRIEVLFTSGYTENAIVHGGRLDPGVALLSKPYRREDLARKIRHIFNNRDHVESLHSPAKAGCGIGKTQKRLRILLVEDNVDALESMVEMTEFLGHQPQGCSSAEDALLLLQNQAFDAMITDIGLPGMSGLALAEKARAIQSLDVTVASGMARGPDVPRNVRWLMKPFGIEEYAALLAESARR
ncbi:MAG TPA: response regulator [Oxalicibacterium sp.]|nr:response regulator [Oxalicibacterium sp.]